MRRSFLSITGFVLAGGASRRMGKDKSQLQLGDETMVERQLRLLRSVCHFIGVIGPLEKFKGLAILSLPEEVPCWPDDMPGRGPLGGLLSGLRRTRTEFNLFLGCDLPYTQARFLHFLCERALAVEADVTIPQSRGHGLEPLCAIYRRRALGAIRTRLEAGENKVSSFFSRARCQVIPWREIARAGFAPRIFDNMNTPEDYQVAKAAIAARNL